MFASAANPGLAHQLHQGHAFFWCMLASIALHTLVLFGLDAPISPEPPTLSPLVLNARLRPAAAAPIEQPAAPPQPTPATSPKADLEPPPAKPATAPSPPKPAPAPPPPRPAPATRPKISKPATKPRPTTKDIAPVEVIEAPPSELAEKAPATASVDAQAAASDQTRSEAARSSAASAATVAESVSQVDGGALDKYRRALIAATRRYKRYPAIAMEKGWQGKVEVHMVIGADGMLAKTSIKSSSGHEVLDDQAVSMLKKGKSTVQIPPGLRSREFSIDVPVIFNLDDPNF